MRNRRPTGHPLLSGADKDQYGFSLMGRVAGPGSSDTSRSPIKDKVYTSAIEMKCPRHRSTVTVDGGFKNIWETRYPITINGAGNIESEYGIRLVDNSEKHTCDDQVGTMTHSPVTTGSFGNIIQSPAPLCHMTSPANMHHPHHHMHDTDPRIESTKLVKSHSCKRYEDSELPVYFDGANFQHIGRNLDTGAHVISQLDQDHNNHNPLPIR